MKLNLFILILFAFSCNQKPNIDYSNLIGTWTSEQPDSSYITPDSTFDVQDRMIFKENDSVIVEVSVNGKRDLMSAGKFSIDKKNGTVTMKMDTFERVSKIIELNNETLVFQLPKGIWRLRRVN